MTKKKTTSAKPRKNAFKRFAQFQLTKTDQENVKKEAFTADGILANFVNLLEEGYAIKLAWDDRSDCPACMLIGERTQHHNQGMIMSGRHKDLEMAINVALYQHFHLSDGEEWDKDGLDPFANDW